MLTAILALVVAFFSPARLATWFAIVRPYLFYLLAVIVVFLGAIWAIHYIGEQAVLKEQAKQHEQVEAKLKADNERVIADKKSADDALQAIQLENYALKATIRNLPTPKQVIAHPKAAEKQFNDTMNSQFKRFEEITK